MRTRLLVSVLALVAAFLPLGALAQSDGTRDEFVLRIDGSEFVAADKVIGVVIIIDGNLDIEGRVNEFVLVVDGDIAVLNGARVDADIVLVDGTLTIRDGATVNGDVRTTGNSTVITEEGSQFNGSVQHDLFDADFTAAAVWNTFLAYLAFWGATTFLMLVAAVVFAGVGGRQLASSAMYMTNRLAGTVVAAIVFWIVTIGSISILFISILGSPLAVFVSIVATVVWVLGYVVAGTRIGAAILNRTLPDVPGSHPYLPAVVGVLILQLINLFVMGGAVALLAFALFEGDTGWLRLLIGVPATLLAVVVWLIGTLGSGALIYRAFRAWTRSPEDERTSAAEPA